MSAIVEVALDSFGPDRLTCGSDRPAALPHRDHGPVRDATGKAVEAAAAALPGSGAGRIRHLEVPARAA